MAFWNRFFGSAGSQAVGVAIGSTAIPALIPAVQFLENEAWQRYPLKPPSAYALAAGVAQGQVDPDSARTWAAEQGLGNDAWDALLRAADTGPAFGNLMDAYRRGLIGEAEFDTGLHRMAIEPQWWPTLRALSRELLSVAELANAVVQGHMSLAAATAEAENLGYTADRFNVLVENTGLPPGPETLLQMLRRGIIGQAEFDQGIREGRTKTKYIDEYLALESQVLSASEYAGLWLRGWLSEAEAKQGGALTGYDAAAMDLLYLNRGRPATTRQAHIGYVRGGRIAGTNLSERETFTRAVRQSNIRTEWEPVLWAQRFTYPSAFVLRSLVQQGDITRDDAEQVLLFEGWEPTFAARVADAWAGGTQAAADPHVGRAATHLWSTLHSSYKAGEVDETEVRANLAVLGIDAAAQDQILGYWNAERTVERAQLTPAQLKKAWQQVVTNPATGAAWTQQDVIDRLVQRGYSLADATTFVQE